MSTVGGKRLKMFLQEVLKSGVLVGSRKLALGHVVTHALI